MKWGKHSSLQEVVTASRLRLRARIVAHAAPRKGWMLAWLAKQHVLPQGLRPCIASPSDRSRLDLPALRILGE